MPECDHLRHQRFLRAFTSHEPAIRAFVRRLVPSQADADDVLQEVAIVLWEKFDEFDEQGSFKAWAYGIARYKVLSWLRDKGRRRVVLAGDVVELMADESLREDTHLARQRAALDQCFQKVPPEDRDLLMRAYQADVTIYEVAQSSGRSVGGFYQWLYRMRQMLLECIERELSRESLS